MINTEEQYVKAIIEQADNTKAIYDLTCFYDQQGNRNGARYLAMQLQKRMLEPSMEPLVEHYCEFLIEKKEMIKNRLLLLCLLFSLIISVLMFVLQIHIGIIVFQFISCMIILFYAMKNRMIKNFLQRQEEALKPYVNEDVWNHLNQ